MKEIRACRKIQSKATDTTQMEVIGPFEITVLTSVRSSQAPRLFSHSGPRSLPWTTTNTKAPPTLVSVRAGSPTWRFSR